MKPRYVKHYALQWSGEDVRQRLEWIDEFENLTEEQWTKLYPYMNDLMTDVIFNYEDDIMEYINYKISDSIYSDKQQIISEIKELLNDE